MSRECEEKMACCSADQRISGGAEMYCEMDLKLLDPSGVRLCGRVQCSTMGQGT